MDKLSVIDALDALAQESRLDIFRLLIEKNPEGYMVGEIGKKLDLPNATLSFHLEKLKQANLVRCEKQGRSTICRANSETLLQTLSYLTENCCQKGRVDCRIKITGCEEE